MPCTWTNPEHISKDLEEGADAENTSKDADVDADSSVEDTSEYDAVEQLPEINVESNVCQPEKILAS